jgi:methylated-DNA-protein-cysteine methyltransferase related protein
MSDASYTAIYDVVRQIPHGKVSSYGRVAQLAGLPGHARMVGYALHALRPGPASDVPWWRVLHAQGRISNPYQLQRALLEAEGVVFDARGYADLDRFLWHP